MRRHDGSGPADPNLGWELDAAADAARSVTFARLLLLAAPHRRALLATTLLMLAGTAIGLLAPHQAGRIVDAAILQDNMDELNRVVLVLVGLFAALGLFAYLEFYLLKATGSRLLARLRGRLFSHLLLLSPDFFERRPVGELLSRLGSDLSLMQGAITQQIPAGIQALVRFVGILMILLVLHTKLTGVALLVIPPVVLVAVFYGRRLERLATREQDALAGASGRAEEALAGIRTVQSFGQEAGEMGRYGGKLSDLLAVQLRNAHVGGAFSGLVQFAAFSAFALVLWYGGRLMAQGVLTPGQLTEFLLYTFSIAVSVGTLGALYSSYKELRGASARIFHLLDTAPRIQSPDGATPLSDARGELCFSGVSFAYPGSEAGNALSAIDLEIQSGEVLGLVGPSGAGKSTLFALLQRFHDPTEGSIQLDGIDLRKLRLEDLRRSTALVPQDIFLFSGSVADNLRFGRPEATDEELRRAAAAAGADEFIDRLPAGYDERVGQRGVRLSAGQRQRLAIARAFLRDPAVLLLDEATSSLDPDSEARVQEALSELMRGRTTLVIAHRLATARQAHRILVLEDGRVVGSGTHDSLYDSNALYRRYWELQSLEHRPDIDRADEGRG
jgi:ABC-type multidrug transport system fused ATPase/permease subunit